MNIGDQFLKAILDADDERLRVEFSDIGDAVNYQDPRTGATAMHYVAAYQMRFVFNWLVKQPGLDYLIQDNKGRLPSDLAYEVAHCPAMGRYLVSKEVSQARAQGIDIRTKLVA